MRSFEATRLTLSSCDQIRSRSSSGSARRLLDLIERSMGKAVSGRDADEVIREFGGPLPASENPPHVWIPL